jgi:F-box protein, helicase, 18
LSIFLVIIVILITFSLLNLVHSNRLRKKSNNIVKIEIDKNILSDCILEESDNYLTDEQIKIIESNGDIKINAIAGSGKTTTLIEYAKAKPENSRILYLAFNKSVKLEAIKKFKEAGLKNVKVETAHSLAYKYIVFRNHYKVCPQGYKTSDIAEILRLESDGEKHSEYIVANHVNKFTTYFCNSDKEKVQELNYLNILTDKGSKKFVEKNYSYIEKQTILFLELMDSGKIEIIHDFYLKKFQLSNPKLNYNFILFDEGQDASPAMLSVFLNQEATKVIVGDTHQQIYGWRHAVNSLEMVQYKTYHLTNSFRFNSDIAKLAVEILNLKNRIGAPQKFNIIGRGNFNLSVTKAILARTNLGLLLKAIEIVEENKNIENIYFEGNIYSYTYADDGTSLYDVLNLFNSKRNSIKDKLIRKMENITDLEDYVEKTEEVQIGMLIEIVKRYGNEIYNLIKILKDKHVSDDRKLEAEIIFSTVHRAKGMEYDDVELVDDFITEKKIKSLEEYFKKSWFDKSKLIEEINLLYVAITRTKNTIKIPESLVPKGFLLKSPKIEILEILLSKENEINSILENGIIIPIELSMDGNKRKAYSAEDTMK